MDSRDDFATVGPLEGVQVVQLATMLGAGHMTALLGDFGASVIVVELPGRGDPLRQMGPLRDGESTRWAVVGRNKRSITLDLRRERGQQIARDLIAVSDVVVENFRPGTVESWGLGYQDLSRLNPGLIMASLSGYGQTGPDRLKPGFGRVMEAAVGLMHSTGSPDGPPTQLGVPLVDYIAGTVAAMGVSMALYERANHPDGLGQWVDVSLQESMVRMMESLLNRYAVTGETPGRTGNRWPNVAPSDVYRTRDGRYIFHSSATQTVFERLLRAIDRTDLLDDPAYRTNAERIEHGDEVNDVIQSWFAEHDFEDAIRILESHDVPVGPVNTMAEVVENPQLNARDSLVTVDSDAGTLPMPGLVPKFSRTPGRISHAGPARGEHTAEVLEELLGYDADEVGRLREEGVV